MAESPSDFLASEMRGRDYDQMPPYDYLSSSVVRGHAKGISKGFARKVPRDLVLHPFCSLCDLCISLRPLRNGNGEKDITQRTMSYTEIAEKIKTVSVQSH
jgi:hypothetical protein